MTRNNDIKEGDKVRIFKKRVKGDKEHIPKWTRNSFDVVKIETHPVAGKLFFLSSYGNKPFLRSQILKVS